MINYENYNLEEEIKKISSTGRKKDEFFGWYGFKKIICELYGLKLSKNLSARVFHAVFPTEFELYLRDSIYSKNPVLCNRQSQVKYLISRGRNKNNTFAVGCLFASYRRYKNIVQNKDAKGTLAFPIHASRYCSIETSYQKYIDYLKCLPEEFQPVSVCLHWRDIKEGIYKIFLDNGIKVYTAGHCLNEDFCDNFYEILRHFKYATSNYTVSSSLLYAMEMGIQSFIYTNDEPKIQNASGEIYGMTDEEMEYYQKTFFDFFKDVIPIYPNIEITEESLKKIHKIMGFEEQTSPNIVRKALLKQKLKNKIKKITKIFFEDLSTWREYKFKIFNFIKFKKKRNKKWITVLPPS